MKKLILLFALSFLVACENIELGGIFRIGSYGASVSPVITGTTGDARATVEVGL